MPFGYIAEFSDTNGARPFQVIVLAQVSIVSMSLSSAPFQCCSRMPQQRSIGLYLRLIGREIEELNRLSNPVDPVHNALEKLSPYATTFRAVIHLDLNQWDSHVFLWGEARPVSFKGIDNEVAGFMRAAKRNVQLPTVLIQDAAGNTFLLGPHVMVESFKIPSGLSASRILTQTDRCLAI